MTDLTTRRVPRTRHAAPPVPAPRTGPASPPAGGVELDRLLALARPSPAQALEIGAGLLTAAAEETPADGAAARAVDPVVADDGRIVLRPLANGRAGRPAAAVLAEVAAATRLPGPAADPRLAELDRAARDLATAGLPVVARRLQEAAAPADRAAVRAELAALVRAVGGLATPAGTGGTGATGARAARAPRRPGRGGRRIGAWLLSVVVLAGVVVSEVVLLGDEIAADIDRLLDAGRGGEEPADVPDPPGPDLRAPAPAAAGPVEGVDLRPLGPCAPGAPCTVRVLVRLAPSAEPQVVTWSYRFADGCAGPAGSAPGGTVAVPPHADRATAVGVVPLPAEEGVALVAVTDAPAAAASAPVVVGSCRPAGPNG